MRALVVFEMRRMLLIDGGRLIDVAPFAELVARHRDMLTVSA